MKSMPGSHADSAVAARYRANHKEETMSFFAKQIDLRNRRQMQEFLASHFRYHTMNSWNRSSSYANCIKVHRIGLTNEQMRTAWQILEVPGYWDELADPIDQFTDRHEGRYTIGSNGRSGGYLVLYQSERRVSQYKSVCRYCGQRNFRAVHNPAPAGSPRAIIEQEVFANNGIWRDAVYLGQSAIQALRLPDEEKLALIREAKAASKGASLGNRCGACGRDGRVNHSFTELVVYSGRAIDQDDTFEDWSMQELRMRVRLVQDFDTTCDQIRAWFITLLNQCRVVERTVMVPRSVKELVCNH